MAYLGVDLGGTMIKAGAIDERGRILGQFSMETKSHRPFENIVQDLAFSAKEAARKAGFSMNEIAGLGVGVPGVANQETDLVTNCNNLSWYGVPLRQELSRYFSIPICIDNDATLAALAESCAGVSQGTGSSVLITLGTGVGGGIVINGRPWSGAFGWAGELGHVVLVPDGRLCTCGRCGCAECYCSATSLVERGKQICWQHPENGIYKRVNGDLDKITARLMIDAAREGDPYAMEAFQSFVRYLAMLIDSVINFFNPEMIVLGGGVSHAGKFLLDAVRSRIPKTEMFDLRPIPRIELAQLGNDAGIIGAGMLARLRGQD